MCPLAPDLTSLRGAGGSRPAQPPRPAPRGMGANATQPRAGVTLGGAPSPRCMVRPRADAALRAVTRGRGTKQVYPLILFGVFGLGALDCFGFNLGF